MKKKISLILIVLSLLGGCGYSNTELPIEAEGVNNITNPNNNLSQGIDYKFVNQNVFAPKCIRCHSNAGGNKGGINLESYAQVKQNIAKIQDAVIVQQFMPPAGPLTEDLRGILSQWIDKGLPETSTDPIGPPPVNPPPVNPPPSPQPENPPPPVSPPPSPVLDYKFVNQNVFAPKCIRCHSNAGGNKGGINLESYAQVKQNIAKIEDAVIVQQFMPPAGPLTEDLRGILSQWIDKGLPETSTDPIGPPPVNPPPVNPPPSPQPENPPPPDQITYNYDYVHKTIFRPYCIRCHSNAGGNVEDVNLETYNSVRSNLKKVEKFVNRGYMPPSGPLDFELISRLNKWISLGAPL